LINLTAPTLSSGMQWLSSTYAQRFNRRRGQVGHLVHGRFKGCLVEEEMYFKEVLRDVVLAPVRAGMVSGAEKYAWSSHHAILGTAHAPRWLAVDHVLRQFCRTREIARAKYGSFVEAGIRSHRNP